MKNLWKTLFVATLFVSCSEANVDEQPAPEFSQGQAIEFYANVGGRTSFFEDEGLGVHWVEGDKVAIRRWYGDGDPTSSTRQRSTYHAEQSGATTQFVWDENEQYGSDTAISWVEEQTNHVTAYYPTTNNAGAHNISGVTLSATQEQSEAGNHDHIGNYMIMSAEPQSFLPDALPTQVSFDFTNLLSIVELTLTGEETKTVSSIELFTTSGNPLTFADGVLNATKSPQNDAFSDVLTINIGMPSVKLSLTTPATVSTEGAKFYFVVLPGAHAKDAITIRAYMEDGSVYGMKMGAIEFKMNKVYRPSLKLDDFSELNMDPAEIEHIFANGSSSAVYGLPVSMEEDSAPILLRPHFDYKNIPDEVKNLQVATIIHSTYPTTNKIVAKTAGWVYMLVGPQTTDQLTSVQTYFTENGWSAVGVVPTKGITKTSQPKNPTMYYSYTSGEDTEYAYMLVYGKEFAVDEEFDMTNYPLTNFQGIRPIAKKITNINDDYLILPFDFSNTQQDWPIQKSFANVLANPYTEPMTYQFLNGISYALDFSYTEGVSSCSWYNNDGTYMMMYIRKSETGESVKLPAIEGYKLVEVQGTTYNQVVDTKCFISSVSAHDYAAEENEATKAAWVKSDEYAMQSGNNAGKWAHTLVDPAANTAYYLVAIDKTPNASPNGDVKMNSLILTYQKVQ